MGQKFHEKISLTPNRWRRSWRWRCRYSVSSCPRRPGGTASTTESASEDMFHSATWLQKTEYLALACHMLNKGYMDGWNDFLSCEMNFKRTY